MSQARLINRNLYRILALLPLLLLLPLTGCKNIRAAQQESRTLIDQLHRDINTANYSGIYMTADPGFRQDPNAEDAQALFKGVHDKLGQANSSELQSTQIMATTNGEFITSSFKSNFANDSSASEQVVWRKSDGAYHLYRYDIRSKAFLK